VTFESEEPAQVRQEPLPVPPAPAQRVDSEGVAEPIAEPKAAKPRKAGAAKGKAKSESKSESETPKAAAAKAKVPKVKSAKRRGKTGRS